MLCTQYHSFNRIWFRICFHFSSFQGKFFFLQRKWPFSTVTTVTTVNYCLFHRTYWFLYCPQVWPLVRIVVTIGNSIPSLSIFTIRQVAGWQRSTRKPPQLRMQNGPTFIINFSLLGGGSRGGVFHKCSDIYTLPPQTSPYQEMLNRYFPS